MGSWRVERLDQLPTALLATIMTKLDISSICSLAVICRAFNSCASHILSFLPNFHILVSFICPSFASFFGFSLLGERRNWILRKVKEKKFSIALSCLVFDLGFELQKKKKDVLIFIISQVLHKHTKI